MDEVMQDLGADVNSITEVVETSFWMGIRRMEERYDAVCGGVTTECGTRGMAYIEEFAAPMFRYALDITERLPDVRAWRAYAREDFGEGIWEADLCPGFTVPVSERVRYRAFYDAVTDRFDERMFDQVVGVFSSGVPFAYAFAEELDADPVIMRYSTHDRDDERVMMLSEMEERIVDDGRYLIAEDHGLSG